MTWLIKSSRRGVVRALLGGLTNSKYCRAPGGGRIRWMCAVLLIGLALSADVLRVWGAPAPLSQEPVRGLAEEVRGRGWIVYGARSEQGDWDLFACRPDGSALHPLTRTADFNEITPQVSRDGRRLLYRRLKRGEKVESNRCGEQGELVVANSDGTNPQALGAEGEFPWASWSPDGRQIASLSIQGIAIVEVATKQVVRKLERKGFFQQMTWSPDGQWLVGVANSYGTGWSIARINIATGVAEAVNRVDCCTPDWFPDSRNVIFSWRPPGQKTNNGYGWTQLWMADAEGQSRRLVYGEDGRHVYGGNVSPDGKYAIFTGNMNEDGDPGNAGAPMGLVRLQDTPIIGGESRELRALNPTVNSGPVLTLPVGWEPCWTSSETPGGVQTAATTAASANPSPSADPPAAAKDSSASLAVELRDRGWIIFSSQTTNGDWDLFVMRPDGSDRRKYIGSPEFNEGGARVSPDGKRVLYYRMPKEDFENNLYGMNELVIANLDGSHPVVYGNQFAWATWGPDGRQVACLASKSIQFVDLETRRVVRELPRKGIVSQLGWSPDGQWLIGTADHLGEFWNIGRVNARSGEIIAVSETDRFNCTSDWVADSRRIVYARGIIGGKSGRAELWVGAIDGRPPQPLYAEENHHVYGACASPDMKYLLFTRHVADATKIASNDATMAIIRWADTPMRGDDGESLRRRFPEARTGPRLDLGPGWEPFWTLADLAPTSGVSAANTNQPATTKP